jgi:hypothetical protein
MCDARGHCVTLCGPNATQNRLRRFKALYGRTLMTCFEQAVELLNRMVEDISSGAMFGSPSGVDW